MEISLSPELMALLQSFLATMAKMQWQYLLAIIPMTLMFLLFLIPAIQPMQRGIMRRWLRFILKVQLGNTVISLVQKQGTSLFDIFKLPFITLDDSQKFLDTLRDIPDDKPVELILHTPGGMVIAAEQIARAIKNRKGKTRAFIPQYAMSGGTLIALACDKIHMGKNALLGPLDPQLTVGLFDMYPCASLMNAMKCNNPHRDDKMLVLADVSKKAINQMESTVVEILQDRFGLRKAKQLASKLCRGNWTHDYGINLERAKELGLQVEFGVPSQVYKYVDTYPCSSSIESSKKKGGNSIRVHL